MDRNIGLDGNSDLDSVRRDEPILTLTLGSDRVLSFQSCLTKNGRNWDESSEGKVKFDLTNDSLFFLLPQDETPVPIGADCLKHKHEVEKKSSGVSAAMTF